MHLLQMEGEQRAQPAAAERSAQRALDQINVGAAIAFDHARSIGQHTYVPADDRPILKGEMGVPDEGEHLVPHRHGTARDPRSRCWMVVDPAMPGAKTHIRCGG